DNSAPTVTSLRAYLVWGNATDQVILGNTDPNSTREHAIRISGPGVSRVLIAYNDLQNYSRSSTDYWDTNKGIVTIQRADHVYIANNTIRGNPLDLGPLGGTPGQSNAEDWQNAQLTNVVVEG